MRIVKSPTSLQKWALDRDRAATPLALVPTMGCLHEGHLSLIARARQAIGKDGQVVVSLFVNPAQFDVAADLAKYPRALRDDRLACRSAGVDILFEPSAEALYRSANSPHSTFVAEERLSRSMEGAARPGHFRGVATIVAKLFLLAQPEVAVFGAKDYQQAAVVGQLIRDLNFPIHLIVAPTVREPDGLAMSSRNRRLTKAQRAQAPVLIQSIQAVRRMVRKSKRPLTKRRFEAIVREVFRQHPLAQLDYVEAFDPKTLEPIHAVGRGTHMALAARLGAVRLIDNGRL